MIKRVSRQIKVGHIKIGGNAPVSIQSMTNTLTKNVKATIFQIKRLEKIGCDIVRVAVPDIETAEKLPEIINSVTIPVIADVHFDYRIAIKSIENKAHGIRINPGNIKGQDNVLKVIKAANQNNVPIRIGVNSGSIDNKYIEYAATEAEAMVLSALDYIKLFEKMDFKNIKVSLKSSDVLTTIESYKIIANKTDYPLHIGITESGTVRKGTIKSSIGIGSLLSLGIGDTIRVSLTADPVEEVIVANEILKSLNMKKGINIISCPTCGRCYLNIIEIANMIENEFNNISEDITIAIMGCVVNGPGEAKDADIGLAGGKNKAAIFKYGKIYRTISKEYLLEEFIKEINDILKLKRGNEN